MDEVPDGAGIAVIGGSGFYGLPSLEDVERVAVRTPFGAPSSRVVVGTLAGRRVAFLARHGEGHHLTPSEVPYRANIYALWALGERQVVAVNAVGSLAERYVPGDLVVPDQLVDFTKALRARSFFGDGVVAHVAFADPFCARVRAALLDSSRRVLAGAVSGARCPATTPGSTTVARTAASRDRCSPAAPSRSCTAHGAWT